MRVKSFHAPTINDAMRMVRQSLGEHAIIISTTRGSNGKSVEVTAAIEDDEAPIFAPPPPMPDAAPKPTAPKNPATTKDEKKKTSAQPTQDPTNFLSDFVRLMRYHNTPDYLAEQLWGAAQSTRVHSLESLIAGALGQHFDFAQTTFTQKATPSPTILMLVGPPGVGKTMTIAKMATKATMERKPVTVITADTYKAGGVEQLEAFTAILKTPLHRVSTPADLTRHLKQTPAGHVILIDTPGVNPYDMKELQALGKLISAADIEPMLVINAGMDISEASDTASNFAYLGISKLIVTKIDATRRLGGILAAAHAGNLALSHFSRHAGAVEGLENISASSLAALLHQFQPHQSTTSLQDSSTL